MQLILGTVQFGQKYGVSNNFGKTNQETVQDILKLAKKNKVNFLDTASAYGNVETLLGNIGVNNFDVISKLMPISKEIYNIDEWVNQSVLEILKNTQKKKLHALLIHHAKDLLTKNGSSLYKSLKKQKEIGLIDKIGISVYDPEDLEVIIKNFNFDIVQLPLNIFDKRFLENNMLFSLKKLGIEIHVRSIFLQGLLLMDEKNIPAQFSSGKPILKKWNEWLATKNITAVEACLYFVKSCKYVDKILVGVQNEKQLMEIIIANSRSFIDDFPDFGTQDKKLIDPREWN